MVSARMGRRVEVEEIIVGLDSWSVVGRVSLLFGHGDSARVGRKKIRRVGMAYRA